MRIVLDTNVIVSALLNPSGPPASVLNLVLRRSVALLLDNRILFGYSDVLHRKKFSFPRHSVDALLDFLKGSAQFITPSPILINLPDEDDRPFFEVTLSGDADFLVTGNKSHFPRKKFIVTPKQFLDISSQAK